MQNVAKLGSRRGESFVKHAKTQGAAVVITTYNHSRFLDDALESCLRQSVPAMEVVVVDDGSSDDPAPVVARYAGVRYIRQENRGLSAARNTGLAAVRTPYVIFLDADDRLLPCAVETGLEVAGQFPDAAFVYGGFRLVDADLRPISGDIVGSINSDPYLAFLRGNVIGMHGAVMYRRDVLQREGGFDEALRSAEDYDVYLRLVRDYAIASHRDIVAEYRKHGDNMSGSAARMLAAVLAVLHRQTEFAASYPNGAEAMAAGQRGWRAFFALRAFGGALEALTRRGPRAQALLLLGHALSMGPLFIAWGAARWLCRRSIWIGLGRVGGPLHHAQYHVPLPFDAASAWARGPDRAVLRRLSGQDGRAMEG